MEYRVVTSAGGGGGSDDGGAPVLGGGAVVVDVLAGGASAEGGVALSVVTTSKIDVDPCTSVAEGTSPSVVTTSTEVVVGRPEIGGVTDVLGRDEDPLPPQPPTSSITAKDGTSNPRIATHLHLHRALKPPH